MAQDSLPQRVGQKYTDVVIACLKGDMTNGVAFSSADEFEAKVGLGYIKKVISQLEKLSI
jgi:hypothetical protein